MMFDYWTQYNADEYERRKGMNRAAARIVSAQSAESLSSFNFSQLVARSYSRNRADAKHMERDWACSTTHRLSLLSHLDLLGVHRIER